MRSIVMVFAIAVVVTGCAHRSAGQQPGKPKTSCPDWSPKFDQIDDPEAQRILRAYQKQGWEVFIREGETLGITPAMQVQDAEEQIQRLKEGEEYYSAVLKDLSKTPFPTATANDCVGVEQRGYAWMKTACKLHKRQNDIRAVEGMIDLIRCRAGSAAPPPLPAGVRVVASFDVQVTPRKAGTADHKCESCLPGIVPMPNGQIVQVGPEPASKPVMVSEGDFLLLHFPNATGYEVAPAAGILQSPTGFYDLPADATGLIKAVKTGTAKVEILGPQSTPGTKPQGGNPADSLSNNWSGYVNNGSGIFLAAAHFKVPQLWGFGNRASTTWLGIDGATTLLQAGTVQESNAGFGGWGESQDYWAFWEIVPGLFGQKIPYTVEPGDFVSVVLRSQKGAATLASDTNVWEIEVVDTTQQWTFAQLVEYKGQLGAADWIEEAPTACNPLCSVETLANYQTVTFEDGTMFPGVLPPQVSFNPQIPSGLEIFAPPAFTAGFPALAPNGSVTMIQNNIVVSTPSNPDGDGDGFTVTYGPNMPPPPGPQVTTTSLPDAVEQSPYSFAIGISGATSPIWSSSQLPPGLNLNSTTGVISGTPTLKGTYQIAVWASDAANSGELTQLQHLSLKVDPSFVALHCKFYPGLQKTICW